jgi:hypothetical protein
LAASEFQFGLRWQAQRDTAFPLTRERFSRRGIQKASSPLRSADAVQSILAHAQVWKSVIRIPVARSKNKRQLICG